MKAHDICPTYRKKSSIPIKVFSNEGYLDGPPRGTEFKRIIMSSKLREFKKDTNSSMNLKRISIMYNSSDIQENNNSWI